MAFCESNRQIHLRCLEIYKAKQTDDNSWREILTPCRLRRIEKDLFKKFVLELSRKCRSFLRGFAVLKLIEFNSWEWMICPDKNHVSVSPTVNQFTVQIQELQDKVNSLNDSMDFHDLETASSSELSHVLSHLLICPSSFGKRCRDSGPQLDTRDSCGTRRKVLENPLTPDEPTSSSSRNVSVRSLTATHCEVGSLSAGSPVVSWGFWKEHSQLCKMYTEICQEVFNLESFLSYRRSLSSKLYGWPTEESGLGNCFR